MTSKVKIIFGSMNRMIIKIAVECKHIYVEELY